MAAVHEVLVRLRTEHVLAMHMIYSGRDAMSVGQSVGTRQQSVIGVWMHVVPDSVSVVQGLPSSHCDRLVAHVEPWVVEWKQRVWVS